MSPLVAAFKDCCHQTGDGLRIKNGELIRNFGLKDFLENDLSDYDDAEMIAIKAIHFFCDDSDRTQQKFKFAVLVICLFLHRHHAKRKPPVCHIAMSDLVKLLPANDESIRGWIRSHFG